MPEEWTQSASRIMCIGTRFSSSTLNDCRSRGHPHRYLLSAVVHEKANTPTVLRVESATSPVTSTPASLKSCITKRPY